MTARTEVAPPASTAAMMTNALAKNPAVGGIPVSDSRNSVNRMARTGSRRIEARERARGRT